VKRLAGKIDLAVSEDLLLRALRDPSHEIARKAVSALELHARSPRVADALEDLSCNGDKDLTAAARTAADVVRKRLS
jgi:hypothetical protein